MRPVWLTDTVTPDLDRALHYTMLWGLEGLELRTVGSPDDRVPHVNEEKLRRRLWEHDLPVAAVVPGLFEGDIEDRAVWMNDLLQMKEVLAFSTRIGCPRIVISAFAHGGHPEANADALRRAGDAAASQGIRLAVLNEAGMAIETGTALARLLEAVDHPAVRAAWDPVAAVQAGEEAHVGLEAVVDRVELVRCANVASEDGGWQPAPIAEGVVDWPFQLRVLHDAGYDGPVSLMVTMEPAPTWGLRQATDLIRLLRSVAGA